MNAVKSRRIWIFSGEASGDIYGARLATELRRLGTLRGETIEVAGMGGPKMRAAGVAIVVDSTELGVVGIVEVIKHLFTFIGIFRKLVGRLAEVRPDAIVLIDYPTFNMMIARQAHKLGIPVIWYVSPQVWVWHRSRIYKLAKYCRKMMVIFPFEVEVYQPTTLDTEFVGHPLLDIVRERHDPAIQRDPDLVVLLPGSRTMEVTRVFKPMLETALVLHRKYPALRFVMSAPREKMLKLCEQIYAEFRTRHPEADLPLQLVCGETSFYQQAAGTGIAASGTVTVESAIAGLPLVVVYRLNIITLLLFSLVVKLYRGFFTMTNIIADKEVFEEFLQHHVCPAELVPAFERIMPGGPRRAEVEEGMAQVKALLSPPGCAADTRAAEAVLETLEK